MGDEHRQAEAAGPNPLYNPREDAIDAIAEHLAEDDTAYEVGDEAERQAQRIMDAIERRNLRIAHPARVAELEADKARLVAALEPFARHANNKLVADAAFMKQAVGVNYGGSSFALPAVYFKEARAELDAVKGDGDGG